MNIFRKIKYEIIFLVLVVLAIISFFIYGKVLEVYSFTDVKSASEATVETSTEIGQIKTTLDNIEKQLSIQNCISVAEEQEAKEACL